MSKVSTNWKTLSSKIDYKNKYWEIWKDEVEFPDGKTGTFYVRRKSPFSVVIPMSADKKLHLVKQFRYHIKNISLEFPMGFVEGKNPYDTAVIELEEEMGMKADKLIELGWYWYGPGTTDQKCYVYLATDLEQGESKPEEGEFFEYVDSTFEEMGQLISQRKILDGPTIVAYHYLEEYIKKNEL